MGNSQTRFDTSPVEEGPPDSNGRSLSVMKVTQRTDYYFGIIYLGTDTTVTDVPFIEYRSGGRFYLNANNPAPQDIDICIVDSYKACATLLTSAIDINTGNPITLSRVFFEDPTSACWTYRHRLGSLVTDDSISVVPQTAENGYRCRVSVGDYKQTAENESRCCRATHINFNTIEGNQTLSDIYNDFVSTSISSRGTCPLAFSNGYSTRHCDMYMDSYCASAANTEACTMYMLAQLDQNKTTLQPFIDYCSVNLQDRVCNLMAIQARKLGQGDVPDSALRSYCTANPNSKNCICYNTIQRLPSTFTQNSYIGPLACWYKPCAEEVNTQFLLTEQIEQRKDCSITRCSIDVGNINIQRTNPSVITLINDCKASVRNRTVLPKQDENNEFFESPIWKMSYMGLLGTSLFALFIFVPLALR